jgi:hypothetical protein
MGIEIAQKRAKSYRKGLDNSRIELATPTLFTRQPDCLPRTYAVAVRKGCALSPGEKVGVRSEADQVVVLRGLAPVATFNNPSAELKAALVESHGEAWGTVQEIHAIARTAEVTVCH